MKIRNGFISNSSSSSFIICAKEDNLELALTNHYEEIMNYGSLDKNSYCFKFLDSLKEYWVRYLTYENDNRTTFSYEIPNPIYCNRTKISDFCWSDCSSHRDHSYICILEKELSKISSLEEFELVYEQTPSEKIKNIFKNHLNMFFLEIYSDGNGANVIQQNSRFTFPTISTKNLVIFPEDDLYN